jgi:hypothetical protein
MKNESLWKKNPILNIGFLVLSGAMLTLTFARLQFLGTVIAWVGLALLFLGHPQAKALGAPPVLLRVRRHKLRILMFCLVIGFLVSPVLLWPQFSKLRGVGIWVFAIAVVVGLLVIMRFYGWAYKKAGQVKPDGAC